MKLLFSIFIAFFLFFFVSCTKNNLEITGRLVHAKNGKPDLGTGVNLLTDLVFKKHARCIAAGRSDSDGYFLIYARARPNGKYYLYATGGKGELIPLNNGESFSANKNGVTDLGEISVSW